MEPKKKLGYPLSVPLGMVLAASAGYMDAYSYLARDKVFANAQTGNIMLLGISWRRAGGTRCFTMPARWRLSESVSCLLIF